jgi:hypothetical protein
VWLTVCRCQQPFALSWGRPRLRGLVCQLSSTRCGRWVRLRALTGSKRSLADRSPASMKTRVHSAMVRIPYRVPHHLSTVRPAGRSRLPWSSRRPTTASSCKPHMKRTTRFRSGSALRFSQPLSGFPASSSSTALFRAATVPERPPSERSPHEDREPLSGSHAPSRLSTSALVRTSRDLDPAISPTPTLARSRMVPSQAGGALSTSRSSLPGHLGSRTIKPPDTARFTHLEAFVPP